MKYALITGASSGLGYQFARLAAKDGYNLIIISRRKDELENVKKQIEAEYHNFVHVICKDLSLYDSVYDIDQELKLLKIFPEVLINNAGFGAYGSFQETEWGKEYQMMELNMVALTHLIKKILPGMIERKKGYILNVASVAAYLPGPYMAVYYASKAYVLSFSIALNKELKGTGINVTSLCPGPTETGFETAAGFDFSSLKFVKVDKAETVAKLGYAAMKKGKANIVTGIMNKLMVNSTKLLPKSITASILASMQKPETK